MNAAHDRSAGSRWFRRVLIGFVLITCLRVWVGPIEVLPRAEGQIPDSGRQRQQQLDATRETNRLLNQIHSTLQKGTLNVRVASTDKKGAAGLLPTGKTR
jgi:hypothetical protein